MYLLVECGEEILEIVIGFLGVSAKENKFTNEKIGLSVVTCPYQV